MRPRRLDRPDRELIELAQRLEETSTVVSVAPRERVDDLEPEVVGHDHLHIRREPGIDGPPDRLSVRFAVNERDRDRGIHDDLLACHESGTRDSG